MLLLENRLGILNAGVAAIDRFGSLMDRAVLVMRRRQGAFLHSWFGPGLPIDGLDLRVAVANAPEIQQRVTGIRDLQDRYRRWEQGPNLLEPVAGLAGVFAGMLIGGLVGAITVGSVVVGLLMLQIRFFERIGTAVGGGMSEWFAWKRLQGVVGDRSGGVGAWYTSGREGARWAEAGIDLGREALGERPDRPTTVRGALLDLADRLAALGAQVLGGAATLLSFVPLLRVLAGVATPILGLIDVAREIIVQAVTDVVDSVEGVVRRSGILDLPGILVRALGAAVGHIVGFVGQGLRLVRRPFEVLATGLAAAWRDNGTPMLRRITEHPVVVLLRGMGAAGAQIRRLGTEIAGLFPDIGRNILPTSVAAVATAVSAVASRFSSPGPSVASRAWGWIRGKLAGGGGPSLPPIPTPPPLLTPPLASAVAAAARAEMAELPLYVVGSVPRVFPAEAARLDARIRAAETEPAYRAAALVLQGAARLAGPEVDAAVAGVSAELDRVEQLLRRRPRARPPVRDVAPPRRLVPVLRRVRVTGTEPRHQGEVRAWVDEVVQRLRAAPFEVPTAATAGAR
ncbi:MAG: hypothetical protein AB7L84_14430 [Acidimicrobiia bacterium]